MQGYLACGFIAFAGKPGQNTRYPLPVPELSEPGPELPEPEVPDPKFR